MLHFLKVAQLHNIIASLGSSVQIHELWILFHIQTRNVTSGAKYQGSCAEAMQEGQ